MKTRLFKPFEKYPESMLLFVGFLFLILGTLMAIFCRTRFDGALDVHFGFKVDWETALFDQGVAVLSLFLFLLLSGCIQNTKTRPIDILSTVLIARIPLYFTAFINLGGKMGKIGEEIKVSALNNELEFSSDVLLLLLLSFVIVLPLMVWSIALLWNGYKVAAHAKGAKAVLLFIGAILLAEVTSKVILLFIHK